jgi:hypothetical protein
LTVGKENLPKSFLLSLTRQKKLLQEVKDIKVYKALDGIDGKDGKKGKDGKDGKDGSPDTPDEVVEKVISSSKLIPKEKVEGLQDIENLARNVALPPTTMFVKRQTSQKSFNHRSNGERGRGYCIYFNYRSKWRSSKCCCSWNGN